MLSKFFQLFDTPKYIDTNCAGISISDNHIRFIDFKNNKDGLYLSKYGEYSLSEGSIVAGNINNPEEIQNVLNKIKQTTQIENVRACIPEEQVYLFEMDLDDNVSPKDAMGAIEFKIEDNVPLPASEVIFDYFLQKEPDNKIQAVVSALPRKIVLAYEELFVKAGFNLYSMGIESQSIASSVIPVFDNHINIIVRFSIDKVGVYIVCDRVVHFTSTFSYVGDTNVNIEMISSEIKKIINYWNSTRDDQKFKISEIFVCGENFDPSITEKLFNSTSIKTTLPNVWQNVFDIKKSVPDISFKDSLKYASAIGLAMPNEKLI